MELMTSCNKEHQLETGTYYVRNLYSMYMWFTILLKNLPQNFVHMYDSLCFIIKSSGWYSYNVQDGFTTKCFQPQIIFKMFENRCEIQLFIEVCLVLSKCFYGEGRDNFHFKNYFQMLLCCMQSIPTNVRELCHYMLFKKNQRRRKIQT